MPMPCDPLALGATLAASVGLPPAAGIGLGAWFVPCAVVAAAALLAWFLRRVVGAASLLLAGLIVGLAAGPGFFGRMAPDRYLELLEGPPAAFAPIDALRTEARALDAVASKTGGDVEGERSRLAEELREAEAHWAEASRLHRRPQEWFALVAAAAALAAGGAFGARLRPGDLARPEPLLLGLWISLPTALCGIAWTAAHGGAPMGGDALALAAALAIGAWSVAGPERSIARLVDRGADRVALAASTVAGCVASIFLGASALADDRGAIGLVAAAALLALPLGHVWRIPRRWARAVAAIALPGMVALGTLRIEPFRDFALWTTLVVYLLAEDGRWLAIAIGERLAGGRPWMKAMLFALVPLRLGPPMAAVGSIGLVTGLLQPSTGFAILLTAVFFEFLGGTRLRVARQLEGFASDHESEAHAG